MGCTRRVIGVVNNYYLLNFAKLMVLLHFDDAAKPLLVLLSIVVLLNCWNCC